MTLSSRLAGRKAVCDSPAREAFGGSAALVAGSNVSCAGHANPGGLRRVAAANVTDLFAAQASCSLAATAAHVTASDAPICPAG